MFASRDGLPAAPSQMAPSQMALSQMALSQTAPSPAPPGSIQVPASPAQEPLTALGTPAASTFQAPGPTGVPGAEAYPGPISAPEPDTSPVQRLEIPDLDLDVQVIPKPFDGTTWDITGLRSDVAWLENTSSPGLGSNTVLAGHVTVRNVGNGPFRYLDRLDPGATIVVSTQQARYFYWLREQLIVKDTDGYITAPTGQAQLTLLTCSHWNPLTSTYTRRLAVIADLVRSEPLPGPEVPTEGKQ